MAEQLTAMSEKSCRCSKLTQLENEPTTTSPSHHTFKKANEVHNTQHNSPDNLKGQGFYPWRTRGWYGLAVCTQNDSNKDSTSLRLQIPLLTCWPPALWCRGGWLDFRSTILLANVRTHTSSTQGPTVSTTIEYTSIKALFINTALYLNKIHCLHQENEFTPLHLVEYWQLSTKNKHQLNHVHHSA